MKFTYDSYKEMINLLKENGYAVCGYDNYKEHEKSVILRHDVDISMEDALKLSRMEKELDVFATYFILLSTDMYNIHSADNINIIRAMQKNGSAIGLHFDEVKYQLNEKSIEGSKDEIINKIIREVNIMSEEFADINCGGIKAVSMHRPSKNVLETDLEIPGIINSYSKTFFKDFKYVSDSRMNWREDVNGMIASGLYPRLHILTHPIWYQEKEMCMADILKQFIQQFKIRCYDSLSQNIRDFETILDRDEI